jgi:hypothetical protein
MSWIIDLDSSAFTAAAIAGQTMAGNCTTLVLP